MKFFKSKITVKAFIFFLIVALLPLVTVSFVLVSSAHTQLLKASSTKQQIIAKDLANKVDSYLTEKINLLSFQSKIYASRSATNNQELAQNLAVLVNQNKNLESIYLLDISGNVVASFNKQGQISKNSIPNQSQTYAFKAVNFLEGKPYIGSVNYINNNPTITIAVPIIKSDVSRNLNNLNAANFGKFKSPSDITGVLVANYNISDLWQNVLSTKIGNGGYAYVVDGVGNLVAHPNKSYLQSHQKISNVQAVKEYTKGDFSTQQTASESGQPVISTPRPISVKNGWAVIVQEPVTSIYAGINTFIRNSTIVGLSAILLSILIAIFFSRQLTEPIKKLSISAKKLGDGELDQVVEVKTHDELEELAKTFNSMSFNIKKLVSDLKTNNLELLTEQTKLNRIINSVSDGIIAVDSDGKMLSINSPAAKLVNHSIDDLINKDLNTVFVLEQENKPIRPELTKPGQYQYKDLVLNVGNKVYYLGLVVFVLERRDSDVAAILTIRDYTQSRELDFMKLDFVAIAAHELRTPLTVVKGYLDMLNTEAIGQLSVFNIENLQKAIVGTNQLRNLISKLLNIARIERGDMEIFIEKLNISKLIRDNVEEHQTQAAQRLQKISFIDKTDKTIYAPADPASIVEVLNNLIGNAIKYTPERGEIKIQLSTTDTEAKIEVIDNGPGVPEDLRKRLFTKFYRAERSLIAGTRGTGLGLFISKTIVELQGGKIGIKPDTGKGSTFWFTLPIYKPELHDKLVSKNEQKGGVRGWFKKRDDHRR